MCSKTMNKEFYKHKKVLITGHTGFKGTWLTCILNYFESDSIGYALNPEMDSLFSNINGDKLIDGTYDNLSNYQALSAKISESRPEIVIHLAAFGFLNECYYDPRRAYLDNVVGTINLLEAVRGCNSVKSVVIVSTDKVYLNKEDFAQYVESDTLRGVSPYSCSKTCMEYAVQDYYDTYFRDTERKIGLGLVRASNVLAGGDHIKTRLIPTILQSVDEGKPVELRNPNQTRPWQSVLDALDGYLTVARYLYESKESVFDIWNIGPKSDGIKSVGWIFKKIQTCFGKLDSVQAEQFGVKESLTLGLDITKAMSELDWEPRLSTDEIVEQVVDFYLRQKRGEDPLDICFSQIKNYYGGKVSEVE